MNLLKQFLEVNKELLPIKMHYFIFMTGLSCALPFRAVFAKQLGISATAVGIIFSVIPFFKIITNPIFGYILDYYKQFKITIAVIMIIIAASHIAMIFIPPREISSVRTNNFVNNFKASIKHSCTLNSEREERVATIHSSWINDDVKENAFICDIECSEIAIEKMKNVNQCMHIPNLQFKIVINVTNCNMSIKLKDNVMNNIHNYTEIEIENEKPLGYINMRDLNKYQNISEEINLHSNITSIVRNRDFRSFSETADVVKENQKQAYSTLSYLNNKDNFKCYGGLLYKIRFKNELLKNNCPCKSEFKCVTEYCFPAMSSHEVSSQGLTVNESEFLSVQFWSLCILFVISSVTHAVALFVVDTVCYEILGDKRGKYGEQRLWGTVGWGIGSPLAGYLNQQFSSVDYINYTPSLCLLGICLLLNLIPIYHLNVSNLVFSSNIWKDVCCLLSNFDIAYNIAVVYTIGVLSGFFWHYQFWFMEEIGASQVLLGFSLTFECLVAEVPCFIVAGWIIKKIGYGHCNSITFLCFGLRYICFVYIYDPWLILPTAFFHGPTYGIFYPSMTAYAKEEAPPGTEATVQSLLCLSFEGLGVASGTFLGGFGIDKLGTRTTFMYSAVISFILFAINVVMTFVISRKGKTLKIANINSK